MKTRLLHLITIFGLIVAQSDFSLKAQTVSNFENLTLSTNSYWDGSSMPQGATFNSGNAVFQNYYDPSFGGYWSGGWAYSNMKDSTTGDYTNIYSARPAIGYNSSANYAVGKDGAKINLNATAFGKVISGLYVTNGTYAAVSMRDGDAFAKKFGGTSGNDPDWFKLTIRKWLGGVMTNDSVEFYLADYRFANNAQDYIVKTWQWVDLTSLGNVDSLQFNLSSSDVGSFGMNTPGYFFVDDFTTADVQLSVQNISNENASFAIYPNPATDIINIDLSKLANKNVQLNVSDISGRVIYSEKTGSSDLISLNMNEYPGGIYFINIAGENISLNKKLIKQ